MEAEEIKPNMRVIYTRQTDKFGLTNLDYGKTFIVTNRKFDQGSNLWLFDLDADDEWHDALDGRVNVPAYYLEPAEEKNA